MALGSLATTERPDEIQIALPAELSAPLQDALDALLEAASGERAAAWRTLAPQLTGASLQAPAATLRELLCVAIEDAASGAAGAAAKLLRGDLAAAAELRAGHDRLGALLDLLREAGG